MDAGCFLWWLEAGHGPGQLGTLKGQGEMLMGAYVTTADAGRAIPDATTELLSQCGDEQERDAIRAGCWYIEMSDLTEGIQLPTVDHMEQLMQRSGE